MKDSTMSHCDSLIIHRSKLKPEYREVFLTAKFFNQKPSLTNLNLQEWTNWFDPTNPTNEIEQTIVKFLEEEGQNYSGKLIEYWFQHQLPGQHLMAHCDYNHKVREHVVDQGQWLHTVEKEKIMSPITIGCYLEATNLEGGDLVISQHTWFDEPMPTFIDEHMQLRIDGALCEHYTPQIDDVIYFEGSKHFHWIEKVTSGERKSMMINFWSACDTLL